MTLTSLSSSSRNCSYPECPAHQSNFNNLRERTKNVFKRCSGCLSAQYCSKECQKFHWQTHKISCKTLQESLKKYFDTSAPKEKLPSINQWVGLAEEEKDEASANPKYLIEQFSHLFDDLELEKHFRKKDNGNLLFFGCGYGGEVLICLDKISSLEGDFKKILLYDFKKVLEKTLLPLKQDQSIETTPEWARKIQTIKANPSLTPSFEENSCSFISALAVLFYLTPVQHVDTIKKLYKALKEDGLLCLSIFYWPSEKVRRAKIANCYPFLNLKQALKFYESEGLIPTLETKEECEKVQKAPVGEEQRGFLVLLLKKAPPLQEEKK